MSGGQANAGNNLGSIQRLWDRTYIGQGFPWLLKALDCLGDCLGHGDTFVKVCVNNALCLSDGQGDFQMRLLGTLLGFLVSYLIAGDPNMTWSLL
ncbi:hypothetical protein TNCV_1907411 [Trichonephila clavipes]|nr:hypothetical protein TNCV_1907411 [Trichonephila clavipes]